jgi:thiamine transport system permease protein
MRAASLSVAVLLIAGIGAALLMLFAQAGSADIGGMLQSAYLRRVLAFTLLQAGLSTLLSILGGVAVARAFAREAAFPGRRALLALMSLPIVLPSLVAVFGIVSIYGRNGALAFVLNLFGIEARPDIYGLGGVVLAHVFFNLPLAVRLLLPGWQSIPVETWRLAAQLGMPGWARFRLIELPMLRRYMPQAAAAIFLLCVGSFAIVLALGGGPGAATFEVAVFEAIRFEFDPPRAALLALCGLALNLACLLLAQRAVGDSALGTGWRGGAGGWAGRWTLGRAVNWIFVLAAALFVLGPVTAAVVDGALGLARASLNWPAMARATATSLGLAIPAALLSLGIALPLVLAEAAARITFPRRAAVLRIVSALPIAVSPMALGLGWFLILRLVAEGMTRAVIGVILLNALISMPFVAAILRPAVERAWHRHARLCRALGIQGWARWRLVDGPVLRPAIGMALAMAAAMALGDLVGIGLFGDARLRNLTLMLYDQIGAYRMEGAAATALLLLLLVFVTYQGIERMVGGRDSA